MEAIDTANPINSLPVQIDKEWVMTTFEKLKSWKISLGDLS